MWGIKHVRFLLLSFFVMWVTGCGENPELKLSGLTSLMRPPLSLAVSHVEIVNNTASHSQASSGENLNALMSPSPAVIVEQWAADRFHATGGSVRAVVRIEEASIREERVPSRRGLFQSPLIKYTGVFSVRFEVIGPEGQSRGYAHAAASTSRVVSESLTVAEREKVWLCLTETSLNQLDEMLEAKIREYLAGFVT